MSHPHGPRPVASLGLPRLILLPPAREGENLPSLRVARERVGEAVGTRKILQHRETTVLATVPSEGNGLVDLKPLHDDKAQRVAERIRLIVMTSNQFDSSVFVASENSLNSVCVTHYNI